MDLRTCEPGDLLVSRHGEYLTYVEPLSDDNYMDHRVMYSNGAYGSRTHDGYVYRKKKRRIRPWHCGNLKIMNPRKRVFLCLQIKTYFLYLRKLKKYNYEKFNDYSGDEFNDNGIIWPIHRSTW